MTPKISFSVWLCSMAAVTLLCCSQPSLAFHQSLPPTKMLLSRQSSFLPSLQRQQQICSWNAGVSINTKITSTSRLQAHELEGAMSAFDNFFRTQPFLSAFVACSVKASAADFLAQTSETEDETAAAVATRTATKAQPSFLTMFTPSTTTIEQEQEQPDVNLNRNVAFLLYGGLYQGMFLQFLYMVVYPYLYGDSVFRVPLTILTDIFAFGPFVTLPLAYLLRAAIESNTSEDNTNTNSNDFEEALQQGIAKYKNHVVTQGLLFKYWSIWAPAQTVNFLFVPEHLRVFFVAFVSFFWVFLLSGISSQQPQEQEPANAARA